MKQVWGHYTISQLICDARFAQLLKVLIPNRLPVSANDNPISVTNLIANSARCFGTHPVRLPERIKSISTSCCWQEASIAALAFFNSFNGGHQWAHGPCDSLNALVVYNPFDLQLLT